MTGDASKLRLYEEAARQATAAATRQRDLIQAIKNGRFREYLRTQAKRAADAVRDFERGNTEEVGGDQDGARSRDDAGRAGDPPPQPGWN